MSERSEIKDSFGRVHDYLRISLTDNCNLRCFYCIPDEDYAFTPTSKIMTAGEIETLAKVFVSAGVKKIRLTGGEPLVRHDAADIITNLSKLPIQLTMTTNGTRVHKFIDVFKSAGIRSINISLDTLKPERFNAMTRRDQFEDVWKNMHLLMDNDIRVKVNVVVVKGLNDQEINDFIAWTRHTPVDVRFIEFMPFTGNRWSSDKVMTLKEIQGVIASQYDFAPVPSEPHDTAKKFAIAGHAGTFAVISTMSAHFCGDCNRIRLTADGKLKNCLFSKTETDLLSALRQGEDVIPLIYKSIQAKERALGGQLIPDFEDLHADQIKNRTMISIGG